MGNNLVRRRGPRRRLFSTLDAQNAEWREKTTNFTVFFTVNSQKCEAKYEKNGGWLSTEETLQWDSLPHSVQDSFKLSKYADWKGISAYSLRTAEAAIQYHLVVTKDDMGRRLLFYSPEGKLVRD
jgi:hypothetical protein